jgi:hypothetical protein
MTGGTNVANLLGMAKTAAIGGNQAEALGYFNRVLELDPNSSDAWMGKGKAAGWQSTMVNIRTGEAIIAFNHAIATAPAESKFAVTNEAIEEINKIVAALYGISRDHLQEFAALDNTWEAYLNQVSQMIDALDHARSWDPTNRTTLDNIVHLCKDNIEGYSFRDQFNNNMPAAYSISESYEKLLRQKLTEAVDAIKTLDSSYAAPAIEKKQADACFVVTATMGDFDHPDVVLLRRFRDRWIRRQFWGDRFIEIYYFVGPIFAKAISNSSVMRRASLRWIVAPAVKFAKSKL